MRYSRLPGIRRLEFDRSFWDASKLVATIDCGISKPLLICQARSLIEWQQKGGQAWLHGPQAGDNGPSHSLLHVLGIVVWVGLGRACPPARVCIRICTKDAVFWEGGVVPLRELTEIQGHANLSWLTESP